MKSVVQGAKALKVTQQDREEFASAIVKTIERDKSKDSKLCAMDLIQLMQDNGLEFSSMLLMLESATNRVNQLLNR